MLASVTTTPRNAARITALESDTTKRFPEEPISFDRRRFSPLPTVKPVGSIHGENSLLVIIALPRHCGNRGKVWFMSWAMMRNVERLTVSFEEIRLAGYLVG